VFVGNTEMFFTVCIVCFDKICRYTVASLINPGLEDSRLVDRFFGFVCVCVSRGDVVGDEKRRRQFQHDR
jgi:hypothetical protein